MRALGESKVLSLCFWCWSGKWGGEVSPRFPCVTSGVWELLLSLFIARWHNLVCLEFLQIIKLMVVGICSIWGWCYSGWRCRTWEQLHSFREVKFLQGYSKTLWMGIRKFHNCPIISWTTSSQSGGLQISEFPISGYNSRYPIWGSPSPNPLSSQF